MDWARQYQELSRICQLWIAATEARDERIKELEAECDQLRQRLALPVESSFPIDRMVATWISDPRTSSRL
jgi:hypothetical protein